MASANVPLIYAHRGARDVAPENTMAAFRAAKHAGADGVECDVSRCATGEIVILHDDTLDRTTNGAGPMRNMAFEALRHLDAGSWFNSLFAAEQLPALEELLDFAGSALRVNIEIKGMDSADDHIEVDIARLLSERQLRDSIIISSFNPSALQRMQAADPGIARALLYARAWPAYKDLVTVLDELPLRALHPEYRLVDEQYVAWAHRRGVLVNVWTVNEISDMQRMIDLGVDGIITDHPALLRQILTERG